MQKYFLGEAQTMEVEPKLKKTVRNQAKNANQSKKIKKNKTYTEQEKAQIWNTFDSEINGKEENNLEVLCSQMEANTREFCELCQNSLSYSEEGFLTCTNSRCGLIYKDILDSTPEWRFYGADDAQAGDPSRCGMPINPLLEESSFGCKVLVGVGSSSKEMQMIGRYTQWQSGCSREKSLYDEFQRITIHANHANISKKIIDDAIMYHKKICEYEKTFRGENKEGIIAASIYISCRINQYPRTAKELATIFHLDVGSATQGCKIAQNILNILEKDLDQSEKTCFAKPKPDDFIDRYCSKLGMNEELTKLCHFVAIQIDKKNLMQEHTPDSIAAGVLYFVSQLCGLNVVKRDITGISELSEVTINKCFKKIESMTTELVPSVILRKYTSVS